MCFKHLKNSFEIYLFDLISHLSSCEGSGPTIHTKSIYKIEPVDEVSKHLDKRENWEHIIMKDFMNDEHCALDDA